MGEVDSAQRFEQVFHDSFRAHERTTLAVVCFALGTWVGGMYTAGCVRLLAAKGYRITVATPGNQPAEIVRVLRQLAPAFDQIVLLGYPPFLKDVIDSAPHQGFTWPRGRMRLVTAGECFSEAWRDLVCGRLGSAHPELDTASLYGTADGGVLASETPVAIRIRRLLAGHDEARRAIFASERMPTLCQYDPATRWFEAIDGQLLFTADGGIPLARYRIARPWRDRALRRHARAHAFAATSIRSRSCPRALQSASCHSCGFSGAPMSRCRSMEPTSTPSTSPARSSAPR